MMMGQTEATRQADDVRPPRRGQVVALTVDATARSYDLSLLTVNGNAFRPSQHDRVFVTLEADGTNDIFFSFTPTSQTDLDNTASIAAGGTLAYANAYGFKLVQSTTQDMRIDRITDRWLTVKTASGTCVLRMYFSSPETQPDNTGA